jgi:hypothetical protein
MLTSIQKGKERLNCLQMSPLKKDKFSAGVNVVNNTQDLLAMCGYCWQEGMLS